MTNGKELLSGLMALVRNGNMYCRSRKRNGFSDHLGALFALLGAHRQLNLDFFDLPRTTTCVDLYFLFLPQRQSRQSLSRHSKTAAVSETGHLDEMNYVTVASQHRPDEV